MSKMTKKTGGPYMQKAGKGPRIETGAGIPKEFMGPAMHEGVVHEKDPPSHTTYSQKIDPDTGNITGMTRNAPSGEKTGFSYPSNSSIQSAVNQVGNLSDVSDFSKKHTRDENNFILVDGQRRTNFTGTQYNMDSNSTTQFIKNRGLDPENIQQNVIRKTHPEVFERLQQGFVQDSTGQSNRNLSYNSLIRTTAQFPQRPELGGPNMKKKK